MPFEEHKNRKLQFGNPYADYEYYGPSSKRTWQGLLISVVFGVGLCYLGWYRWHQINLAEVMGDTISLTSIEWMLYNVAGKWAVAGTIAAIGILFAYLGIHNYRRLENMKQSR
jgi:uncharacterized membrane protein YidH (DUF202 family)